MAIGSELQTAITTLATAVKAATGIVTSASYNGSILADDKFLFLNTGTSESPVYTPVKTQITELTGGIETETTESIYLYDRGSKTTTIKGKSRSLTITAEEFVGEAGIDYIMSKRFATSDEAKTDYAIWNLRTGAVEMADCTIDVTEDISGTSGENCGLSISILSNGIVNTQESFVPSL